ncbi:hypothetical protein [Brucella sp. NBRC 12950]|uniref:hypothetical protein n=1 Tax=Brucella sp. NBRC 12950 TaxID=2994518 RepID=UPI0024A5DE7F|nr:hypothetical protein [Brucella sp. NBRC 12950]GLU29135.1 hypothetical protein Brsp01_43680 [Brucella sp. NBRC 12950]
MASFHIIFVVGSYKASSHAVPRAYATSKAIVTSEALGLAHRALNRVSVCRISESCRYNIDDNNEHNLIVANVDAIRNGRAAAKGTSV